MRVARTGFGARRRRQVRPGRAGGSLQQMTSRDTSVVQPVPAGEGDFRTEHDSMGAVKVPAGAKWQAQTQRAVENFPVSGQGIERSLVRGQPF